MASERQNNRALLGSYPSNIGVLAMDIYFPSQFVEQKELEKFDQVSAGKYTIGLGQQNLAFVTDREDVYSIALTVVSRLMRTHGIKYEQIGRLEVATETIMDHSKSIKTVLMQLFQDSGNSDVEGVDTINACYAGTNALFNSIAWIESSAWDGRLALVVTADIAEYAKGAARPTGGVGAVAMLIGPGASVVFDASARASHMAHSYDFFKPHLSSPYPVVDGKGSAICYLRSLDTCYQRLRAKRQQVLGEDTTLSSFDHVVFHAPYNKLVQKSYARLLYNDFVNHPDAPEYASVASFAAVEREQSYEHRELETAFVQLSKAGYARQVAPTTHIPVQLGNIYTASLFSGLLSLLTQRGADLAGARILLFAYGSGLASSAYVFNVSNTDEARAQLSALQSRAQVAERLVARRSVEPSVFDETMQLRERLHHSDDGFQPQAPIETLFPGTYYLLAKDDQGRRKYDVTPLA